MRMRSRTNVMIMREGGTDEWIKQLVLIHAKLSYVLHVHVVLFFALWILPNGFLIPSDSGRIELKISFPAWELTMELT